MENNFILAIYYSDDVSDASMDDMFNFMDEIGLSFG